MHEQRRQRGGRDSRNPSRRRQGCRPGAAQALDHFAREAGNRGIGKVIAQRQRFRGTKVAQFTVLPRQIGRIGRILGHFLNQLRIGRMGRSQHLCIDPRRQGGQIDPAKS